MREYERRRPGTWPNRDAYVRAFGSWSQACKAAGLAANLRGGGRRGLYAEEDALAILRQLGPVVSVADYQSARVDALQRHERWPSVWWFQERWGSWSAACRSAGVQVGEQLTAADMIPANRWAVEEA